MEEEVAPRVGAWIETRLIRHHVSREESHPVWVRGLKPVIVRQDLEDRPVAPRVGAWIET